jgi:hypothetical protein
MMTALEEVHRGTHRPYPCGAGAGYFGVSRPTGCLRVIVRRGRCAFHGTCQPGRRPGAAAAVAGGRPAGTVPELLGPILRGRCHYEVIPGSARHRLHSRMADCAGRVYPVFRAATRPVFAPGRQCGPALGQAVRTLTATP